MRDCVRKTLVQGLRHYNKVHMDLGVWQWHHCSTGQSRSYRQPIMEDESRCS